MKGAEEQRREVRKGEKDEGKGRGGEDEGRGMLRGVGGEDN